MNPSVTGDAVIADTGRRRARTGKTSHGAAPDPAGEEGRAQGRPQDLPPLPFEMRYERGAGACPCLPSARDAMGQHQEKPLGFFTAKRPVWKRPLCSSPTATALQGSVQLGLGQTAHTHTLYKGSDPTVIPLSAITRSKPAAAQ